MSNYRDDVREMMKKFKTNKPSSTDSTPTESSPAGSPSEAPPEEAAEAEVTPKPTSAKEPENSSNQVWKSEFLTRIDKLTYTGCQT